MTSVTDTDGFRVRWQRQFVTGTSVAEDVPAVPAVVLQTQGYNNHNCLKPQHQGEGNQTSQQLLEHSDITLRSRQAQPSPQLCSCSENTSAVTPAQPRCLPGWRSRSAAAPQLSRAPSGQPLLPAQLYGRRGGAWAAGCPPQAPQAVPTHQQDPSIEV